MLTGQDGRQAVTIERLLLRDRNAREVEHGREQVEKTTHYSSATRTVSASNDMQRELSVVTAPAGILSVQRIMVGTRTPPVYTSQEVGMNSEEQHQRGSPSQF